MRHRKPFESWCVCKKCSDTLTVVFWMRKKGDRYLAQLEPNIHVSAKDGLLIHRPGICDGILRVMELPGPTVLES